MSELQHEGLTCMGETAYPYYIRNGRKNKVSLYERGNYTMRKTANEFTQTEIPESLQLKDSDFRRLFAMASDPNGLFDAFCTAYRSGFEAGMKMSASK
jgi:hypothetical protein